MFFRYFINTILYCKIHLKIDNELKNLIVTKVLDLILKITSVFVKWKVKYLKIYFSKFFVFIWYMTVLFQRVAFLFWIWILIFPGCIEVLILVLFSIRIFFTYVVLGFCLVRRWPNFVFYVNYVYYIILSKG